LSYYLLPLGLVFGRVKIEKLSATTLRVELIDLLSWGPNPNCSLYLCLWIVMGCVWIVVSWYFWLLIQVKWKSFTLWNYLL